MKTSSDAQSERDLHAYALEWGWTGRPDFRW